MALKLGRRAYVVFEGGLGNQLFEFTAAASVAGAKRVRLLLDRPTPFVTLEAMVPGLVRRCGVVDQWRLGTRFVGGTGWRRYINRALRPVRSRVARRTLKPGGDLDNAFNPRPQKLHDPLVFDGYFQHPDWYQPAKAEVIDRIIEVMPADLRDEMQREAAANDVVVVVRGGDYATLGWQLSCDYYERAADLLGASRRFRIVTDDPTQGAVVATALVGRGWVNSEIAMHATPVNDFWAIARARTVVMANSTFCWWATCVGDRLLASAANRRVIFPEQWILGYGAALAEPTWQRVTSDEAIVPR